MTSTALVSIAKQKTALQERAAAHMLVDYEDYRDAVSTDGSVDDKRKLLELQMRLTGAEMERKVDQNAHLATFNFVFNNGITATMVPAPTEVVDMGMADVVDVEPTETPPPPPGVRPMTVEMMDVDAMLGDLDEMNIY